MFAVQQNLIIMENNKSKLSPYASMTRLDWMLKSLSETIAVRMHKHISIAPDAIDDGDIIVEREGWLTEEDLLAAAHILKECGIPHSPEDSLVAALRRNIL